MCKNKIWVINLIPSESSRTSSTTHYHQFHRSTNVRQARLSKVPGGIDSPIVNYQSDLYKRWLARDTGGRGAMSKFKDKRASRARDRSEWFRATRAACCMPDIGGCWRHFHHRVPTERVAGAVGRRASRGVDGGGTGGQGGNVTFGGRAWQRRGYRVPTQQ